MTTDKKRIVYNKELLDTIVERDGATLVGEYEKLDSSSRITFICACGVQSDKKFIIIVHKKGGIKCINCVKINAAEKCKKTCLQKYGTESHNQNKQVKENKINSCKKKYGVDNPFQLESFQKKRIETSLKKYGVEHHLQNKSILQKQHITNIEKYGHAIAVQSAEIQDKIKNTNLEKYGVEHTLQRIDVRQKGKETNIKKYGNECVTKVLEIQDKIKSTNLKKYGVERPTQNPEIQEKAQRNALKFKEYKMPSGQIRKVQGFEPFALDALLKLYQEDQIKTDRKEVPRIPYKVDDKQKYYFPDIFIPHKNKIIEVKSTYTYKIGLENIALKKQATEENGYSYELWCFDKKGNRVEV